jgi:hypothetical protein
MKWSASLSIQKCDHGRPVRTSSFFLSFIHSLIHSFIHSLTHSTDWKGFYNFCYLISPPQQTRMRVFTYLWPSRWEAVLHWRCGFCFVYIYVCRLTFISKIIAFHLCHVQNWVDCCMPGQIKMWPLILGRSECDLSTGKYELDKSWRALTS